MPTFEHNTLRQYKDQNGDMHLDYPITKAENVVGLYRDAALTGVPTAPTAEKGTNTEQVATTAFVQNAISGLGGSGGGTTSEDVNNNTVFMDDGSSVTTYEDGRVITTVANDDGSITETTTLDGTVQQVKNTAFNEDGSVSTTYTKGG